MTTLPIRQSTEIEVRYAETDQMGVVHHAAYYVWFEQARTHLCWRSGHHYSEVETSGFFLVVTRTEARYLKGATYGDNVVVTCWIDKMTSRGLRFRYEVFRGEEPLATGATEHIWVDRASGRPCRTPPLLAEPFARLAGRLDT